MRLIDADALKDLEEMEYIYFSNPDVIPFYKADAVWDVIENAPTVDAVEVVRCKDCKHCWYDEMFGDRWCNGNRVHTDSFCSDGERRDSDG